MALHLIPSDATIKAIRPGDPRKRLSDGAGLYLLLYVNGGSHGWRFDYTFEGRRKLISLGTYPATTLAIARRKAEAARQLVAEGFDPSAQRKSQRAAQLKTAEAQTRVKAGLPELGSFEAVAREWYEIKRGGWAPSYGEKIMARLEGDVFPWLGRLPIATIPPTQILEVIRRVEDRGVVETAHRVLESIGQIYRYAVACGKATYNPARDLKEALKPATPRNFPAITDPERFGQLLRACDNYAATPVVRAALKLAPMLLLRPGELRFAEWHEIDLDAALWTVPAARMKRELRGKNLGAPHLVPLPRQAVAVLRDLHPLTGHATMVFRGERHHHRAMSENTVNAALRAMGFSADEVTGHGFRATARTMLHERLGFSPDVIEAQLAHSVRDSLGRAYNRTEFVQQRREMLQTWADFLDKLRTLPAEQPTSSAKNEKDESESPLPAGGSGRELSTIETAKFLNASLLFVETEVEEGRLPSRVVGRDRRIAISDLVAYALQMRLGISAPAAPLSSPF
jgi:integrase